MNQKFTSKSKNYEPKTDNRKPVFTFNPDAPVYDPSKTQRKVYNNPYTKKNIIYYEDLQDDTKNENTNKFENNKKIYTNPLSGQKTIFYSNAKNLPTGIVNSRENRENRKNRENREKVYTNRLSGQKIIFTATARNLPSNFYDDDL